MRQLRVLMQPIRTEGPGGRAIVSGFELDFSPLGRATVPAVDQATAMLELLPLRLTHAVFELVDGAGKPLQQVAASFQASDGEAVEATTDDFGEIFLDGAQGQTYSLLELLPADDDRVAVIETRVDENVTVA